MDAGKGYVKKCFIYHSLSLISFKDTRATLFCHPHQATLCVFVLLLEINPISDW